MVACEHAPAQPDAITHAPEFAASGVKKVPTVKAVQFGLRRLQPQAGLAVYERGQNGLLHAARVYDDVNVEALSGAGPHHPPER